jgi:hypothetical protein
MCKPLLKAVDLGASYLVSESWDGGVRVWLRNGEKAGECVGSAYHHMGPVTRVCLRYAI